MMYCYHCTTRLSKKFDICPHCNKTLDLNTLKTIYDTGSSREVRKSAVFKIWLTEHSRAIVPIFTFAAGIVAGIIIWWGQAQGEVAVATAAAQAQVFDLQARVTEMEGNSQETVTGFESQIANRDSVIICLKSQKETLVSLINFTRRLSENATITPKAAEHSDSYRRNSLYLIGEFNRQQEALLALGQAEEKSVNLQTMPQLLSSETAELTPEQL
jgi:hypothetical protein